MSAANEISLDELGRLIRLLGMLGSQHDGEALNAARLACRWVAEKQTSWATLLTPEPEPAVSGVAVAGVDPELLDALEEAHQADRAAAYRNGYQAGLQAMAAQLKAQAAALHGTAPPANGPGSPQTPPRPAWATAQGGTRPAAPAASQAPPGGQPGVMLSWQMVAQELLARHAAVPGVLRSREEAFVQDVLKRGFATLTTAQEAWLRDIAGRAGLGW